MYYLTNESIIAAIKNLHKSGTHDYFRTYLTLKTHGLALDNPEPVSVNTTNTTPSLQYLFGVDGLAGDSPFYNPFRNERLKADAARGVIQTHVKKFLDEATKTKMSWIKGEQGADKAWNVLFSEEYPQSLGRGEKGLAISDDVQITIHRPSFVVWMFRNAQWDARPKFSDLWDEVKKKIHLNPVEIDLLFTRENDFVEDPFTDSAPNRTDLISFIESQTELGTGKDVLKAPERKPFSDLKVQRIISSEVYSQQTSKWWGADNVSLEAKKIVEETRALLLIGAPGTGKTRLAINLGREILEGDDSRLHLFQFHASYTYEDFIEALRPEPDGGSIKFEPVLKRFAVACKAAQTSPQVVILDELNRADVSKVFGEAFFLIERSYREPQYAIPHLYNQNERFWIPPDLYLIATLNDLDKTTYDLDFAFRRRFGQIEVTPDQNALEEVLRASGCNDEIFIRILRSAFWEIQTYYRLGHAYFKSVKDRETLKSAYRRVIRPTIESYLGQYKRQEMDKIDSIIKRVFEVKSWEEYIDVEN